MKINKASPAYLLNPSAYVILIKLPIKVLEELIPTLDKESHVKIIADDILEDKRIEKEQNDKREDGRIRKV